MSEKDFARSLIDQLPDEKLAYAIGYLQGLAAQEAEDDAFCDQLYQAYLSDADPEKDVGIPLEQCKAEWGIE
ncbi:MAG: hypothetical protein K6G90_06205 [Clostridia bacterium]|nr:hypothetical protein [Clostridia bacterium]